MENNYTEIWNENPLQIVAVPVEDIIIMPEYSGRSEFKRDPKKLKELAEDIDKGGQLEPALVALNKDPHLGDIGAPVLIFGFGRYEAVKSIGKPLMCRVTMDGTDNALLTGMRENIHREQLSSIQVAYNIKRLNEMGMKDSEIARQIKKSPAFVSLHKRFLSLDVEGNPKFSKFALMEIHRKNIPERAAMEFADLDTAEAVDSAIRELLDAANGGKVGGDAVREVVRKKATKKKGKKGKEGNKVRSVKETKTLFEQLTGPGASAPEKKLAGIVLSYISGEKDLETTTKALGRLLA